MTMRTGKLYVFTGIDGKTFTPSPGPAIEAGMLLPGAQMLFDPTLVELPDGRIGRRLVPPSSESDRRWERNRGVSDPAFARLRRSAPVQGSLTPRFPVSADRRMRAGHDRRNIPARDVLANSRASCVEGSRFVCTDSAKSCVCAAAGSLSR